LKIGKTYGRLSKFILEPLVKHTAKEELYVAIYSKMEHDVIMFYEEGGVEIGDVDEKVCTIFLKYLNFLK
jgi:ATP citrate (pro-S)-lyase